MQNSRQLLKKVGNKTKFFTMKKSEVYLTRTGLLFVSDGQYFFSNDGTFRRKASSFEKELILGNNPVELKQDLHISGLNYLVKKMEDLIPTIGEWEVLISGIMHKNDYDYNPELCNNGGKYSFWTKRIFLFRKIGDAVQLAYIDLDETSAEFDYCEISARFTAVNLERFEDCEDLQVYSSQPLGVVEQYCKFCTVDEMFKMTKTYIFPKEDDRENTVSPLFSLTEKKEILRILKENGWKNRQRKNNYVVVKN